jgi:hypothetical protein
MGYRYIMQHIVLNVTELNPFQIVTKAATNEDVAKMLNHMMTHETLASLLLHVQTGGSDAAPKSEDVARPGSVGTDVAKGVEVTASKGEDWGCGCPRTNSRGSGGWRS